MKSKTVLVVDDDGTIRELLEAIIGVLHPDIIVIHAKHGEHAWEILNNSDRFFNLLISDTQMPIMDGVELVERVRKAYPETHIILMSGNPEPESHEAHTFMAKPFGSMEVMQRVATGLLAQAQVQA